MGKLNSTENSLNQHIRLKHKEFWETIRRKCAQLVAKGQYSDTNKPEDHSNNNGADKEDEQESRSKGEIQVDIGIMEENEKEKKEDL